MTFVDRENLLRAVAEGKVEARAAMTQLVAGGMHPDSVEERVFLALGGGELVEVWDDGTERYADSGKLVEDVERLMRE